MHAALRSLSMDPDPRELGGDPADFAVRARLVVGPSDGPGEESFDMTVCSPQWLARTVGPDFLPGRHHLIVDADSFSVEKLQAWIEQRLRAASASSWVEVADVVSRWALWEFEDYRA